MFSSDFSFAIRASAVACCLLAAASAARAQVPNSFGAYYTQQITKPGAGLGQQKSNQYLYDKYFYQRPTVSPYLSLSRPGFDPATNYHTYVRPELDRREAQANANRAYIQQRKLEGRVGETRYPGAVFSGGSINNASLKPVQPMKTTPSSYYNHWYGGWANR